MHAYNVLTALYPGNTFRFCIHPGEMSSFAHEEPLIGEIPHIEIEVQKDAQGMLRAQKKQLRFIHDPPTGHFKFSSGDREVMSGVAQTGKFNSPSLFIRLTPDSQILGFGAAADGFDRNQKKFRLLNIDTLFGTIRGSSYSSFPFFLIRRQEEYCGVFVNTVLPADVEIDTDDNNPRGSGIQFDFLTAHPLPIDLFIFRGKPAEILDRYTELTGRPFLPPVWSLGFQQSRWSYKTQERVLEIAGRFRKEDLPCDAIYLDIHYMQNYRVFTWHDRRFPHPEEMNRKLREMGFHSVAIVDPGVAMQNGYQIYDEGHRKGYFCITSKGEEYRGRVWPGPVVFPDFNREDVRDWWARSHRALLTRGVSGIWNDMNDPALKMGKRYDPLKEDIRHNYLPHGDVRNFYGNFQARAAWLAFQRHQPDRRPFILTRSACSGIQRYAAMWTGDNITSWTHLRQNLHMVINLGLCGVPFCGADVGGFAGGRGPSGMFKFRHRRELFARWMELGSLMPFFRAHTVLYSTDQEPWNFGEETLRVCRKHIKRRYRLLPYIYTLMRQSRLGGAPLVRPLFFEYPRIDPALGHDQFMLGPWLLAAPVLRRGVKKLEVYLPPGEWYEYETQKKYTGNQKLTMDVASGYYPLFVKAGAILPICGARRNAIDSLLSEIAFEIYPAAQMSGEWFSDDGLSTVGESQYLHLRLHGKKERNDSIIIDIEQAHRRHTSPFRNMFFRLPPDYRTMNMRGRSSEARILDLTSEDRPCRMAIFQVPTATSRVEFGNGH